MMLHPHSVAEQSSAGNRTGGIYANDANGEVLGTQQLNEPVNKGALASAGGSRDTYDVGPAGMGIDGL
jgi:hypothetical protein